MSETINQPLVSIIVPAYNYGRFVSATLEVLTKQEYHEWEAIIVDDGSTDDTKEVVQRLAKDDNRLKYFYKQNGGLADARNYGISKAKGKYIQFLDADDFLSSEKLSIQVAFMETNPECDISYTSAKYFADQSPNTLYASNELRHTDWMLKVSGRGKAILKHFINENVFPVNSPLIRTKFIEVNHLNFNVEMRYLEDWEFWIRCVLCGAEVKYVPDSQAFCKIRVHNTSLSVNKTQMYHFEKKLFKELYQEVATDKVHNRNDILYIITKRILKAHRKILIHRGLLDPAGIKEIFTEVGFIKTIKVYAMALNHLRKGC